MRRVIAAAVLAVLIATGAVVLEQAMNSIGQPSQCDHLDPDTNWFLWWYYGCDSGSAPGGGGSGAGEL
jgi:hypothetical protein